jgi:hypothetical protein
MTKHLGAIDTNPIEGRVREPVSFFPSAVRTTTLKHHQHVIPAATSSTDCLSGVYIDIPAQLLCEEVLHARFSDQLRVRCSESKRIREPSSVTSLAES